MAPSLLELNKDVEAYSSADAVNWDLPDSLLRSDCGDELTFVNPVLAHVTRMRARGSAHLKDIITRAALPRPCPENRIR